MSVLTRMESMQPEFSAAESKLYQYIANKPETVPGMTASELACAAGISAPTVVRFSKKIGFNSLTDFKISLSTELSTASESQTVGYTDIGLNETFPAIKTKLSNNAQFTIKETADILDEGSVTQAVELLEKKPRCFVFGVGASRLAAEDIVQKWTRLGKNVVFEKDVNILLPQMSNDRKRSVLWLISNSGLTPEVIALADMAKKIGIPVISLTQLGSNPLSNLADVAIQISRPMESLYRSAATNSIVSQFVTVDILFYLFISRNKENAKKIRETRSVIDEFRKNYFG